MVMSNLIYRERYGYSIPVYVQLGSFKMYLVSAADHYTTLFNNKASRSMGTKAGVLLALKNLFGTPTHVIPFYAADNSGVNAVPLPGSNVRTEHRVTYRQTRAATKHLSGSGLVQMTKRFLKVLQSRVHESSIDSEWTDLPDLYRFLQSEVFSAAVEAMCGSYLLRQSQHLSMTSGNLLHMSHGYLPGSPGGYFQSPTKSVIDCTTQSGIGTD